MRGLPLLFKVQLSNFSQFSYRQVSTFIILTAALLPTLACIAEQESFVQQSQVLGSATSSESWVETRESVAEKVNWCLSSDELSKGRRLSTQSVAQAVLINQGLDVPLWVDGVPLKAALPVIVGRRALVELKVDWFGAPAEGAGALVVLRNADGEEQFFADFMADSLPRDGAVQNPIVSETLIDERDALTPSSSEVRASVEVVEGAMPAEFPSEPIDRTSYFFDIPSELISADSQISVELFEAGDCAADIFSAVSRNPQEIVINLPTRSVGALKVVIVPIRYLADESGRMPDLEQQDLKVLREMVEAMFPVPSVEFTIHDAVDSYEANISAILSQLIELRNQEQPADNVAYFGFVNPADSMTEYCGESCVAGVSAVGTSTGRLTAGIGVGFRGKAQETFVHELGHILQLGHAPCGDPGDTDENFPHLNARIGLQGYDYRTDEYLPTTGESRDFMSYCDPSWISDYHFEKLVQNISLTNGLVSADIIGKNSHSGSLGNYSSFFQNSIGQISRLSLVRMSSLPRGAPQIAELVSASGKEKKVTIWAQELSESEGTIFDLAQGDWPEEAGSFVRLPSGALLTTDTAMMQPFSRVYPQGR